VCVVHEEEGEEEEGEEREDAVLPSTVRVVTVVGVSV
jgi:hypothetical protein